MSAPGVQDARDDLVRRGFAALNRVVVPAVKAGFATPPPVGAGLVVVETTGRITGRPREVPLLGLRIGDRVIVSTVRGRSQWAANLAASGDGAVWVCGSRRRARARVDDGPLTVAVLDLAGRDDA